jgi:magnesium chelatase subunit D
MKAEYPFSALVGQEELKLVLLLAAVDPTIGGVLVRGERGTAKSTAARGLAALLPARYRGSGAGEEPAPFIELPLGATEDRVVGSLDVTKALREGHTQLRSGVLARADGGVLYVDEVNLLPDHLVDLLLDAAASGWVTVERDGMSAGEAARFVLIGTMNPEEGELRPQFLDRFGLSVHVQGLNSQQQRMAAVAKRLEFDADPAALIAAAQGAEQELRRAILEARGRLPALTVSDAHLSAVTAICGEQRLEGIRGDLALIKAARALAAWEAASEITPEHIRRVAVFVLPHRLRGRAPLGAQSRQVGVSTLPSTPTQRGLGANAGGSGVTKSGFTVATPGPGGGSGATGMHGAGVLPDLADGSEATGGSRVVDASGVAAASKAVDAVGALSSAVGSASADGSASVPAARTASLAGPTLKAAPPAPAFGTVNLPMDRIGREGSSRRDAGSNSAGRVLRAMPYDRTGTLAINETLTAAASRGARAGSVGVPLSVADLRQHERVGSVNTSVLFLVDASASMATRRRLEMAKGAAAGLLRSNYQRRDEVALMVFRGEGTDLLVPFTNDVAGLERALANVPTGGRTPLARALKDAADVLRARKPALLVILTDGRANVSMSGIEAPTDPWEQSLEACGPLADACAGVLVIDCEPGPIMIGRARQLAEALQAECVALRELEEADLTLRIQERIEALQ